MNDTIVVKIGTESLMDFEQSEKVQKLVDTIISQTKQGIRILLVTSGAVGFGRKTLGVQKIQ
jgi:glutamate 5-kinase